MASGRSFGELHYDGGTSGHFDQTSTILRQRDQTSGVGQWGLPVVRYATHGLKPYWWCDPSIQEFGEASEDISIYSFNISCID